MPTVTCCDNCVRLPVLVGRDLKSVMRCNHFVQKIQPTQCSSDTRVVADISLGISWPSTK